MRTETTCTTVGVWLLGAAALTASGCEGPLTVLSFSGATMGTSYEVVVETDGSLEDTTVLGALVEGELERLERVMSTYDPRSDVSRFGAYGGADPVVADPALVAVVATALEVSRRSAGAFDPTVAPLVDAWGFGPVDLPPPDSSTVGSLLRHVGYERLEADTVAGTLAKADPLLRIDLSGIAKGFAAQRVAERLAEAGYESALVDVGGELRVLGAHSDGRPWRVAAEGPGQSTPTVLGTIDLVDEAIATSGDFRNYYEDAGIPYAHIIDPRTGFPIRFRGFSVSVVHPDATMADAWATALTVLGPEEGYELAEREGLAAIFAWRAPDGVLTRTTTALAGRLTPVE